MADNPIFARVPTSRKGPLTCLLQQVRAAESFPDSPSESRPNHVGAPAQMRMKPPEPGLRRRVPRHQLDLPPRAGPAAESRTASSVQGLAQTEPIRRPTGARQRAWIRPR